MKRINLVKIIEKSGAVFIRHGSDHDWYKNPETGIAAKYLVKLENPPPKAVVMY